MNLTTERHEGGVIIITLGSLFDGSGGFPLAGVLNGITPLWASEIEPYPIRVTKARFPNMKHLGSVLDINGAEIEPVDIITFGSPCQDLSVAGKQKGIHEGERSNLFFEAIRIAKEMREHDRATGRSDVDLRPRFLVWENVPGAFSSNQGEDFRAVLEALGGIAEDGLSIPRPPKGKWNHAGCVVGDGWSIAWRVYDAQYWGVPQRRKRIYLVADFASERAGEILFEREGVRGHYAQSGTQGQGTAADAEGCTGTEDCAGECTGQITTDVLPFDTTQITNPQSGSNPQWGKPCHTLAAQGHPPAVIIDSIGGQAESAKETDIAPTLKACHHKFPPSVAISAGFKANQGPKAGNIGWQAELACTLNADCPGLEPTVCYKTYGARGNGAGETVNTITGDPENRITDWTSVVCMGNGQLNQMTMAEQCNTLDCMHDQQAVLMQAEHPRKYIVRRLTPLECCRLQDFPDWWEEGVQGSDTARYKMWGNGIALPCAADVLKRIKNEIKEEQPCMTTRPA